MQCEGCVLPLCEETLREKGMFECPGCHTKHALDEQEALTVVEDLPIEEYCGG